MAILISWENRNQNLDQIKLYRSTSPNILGALPTPLVTLTNNESEYEDTTAVKNVLYYYLVEYVKDGQSVYSKNSAKIIHNTTGAGSSKLRKGDVLLGVMDILPVANFLTWTNIFLQLGGNLTPTNNPSMWYKCIYKGKILYIPNVIPWAGNGVTLSNLFNNGIAYGVPNSELTAITPLLGNTEQRRTVFLNDSEYIVRIITLTNSPYSIGAISEYGEYEMFLSLIGSTARRGTAVTTPWYGKNDTMGLNGAFNIATSKFMNNNQIAGYNRDSMSSTLANNWNGQPVRYIMLLELVQ